MSKDGRPIFKEVWRQFIRSLTPKVSRQFVGKDVNGIKYYEDFGGRGTAGKNSRRYYVSPEDMIPELPAEWESWLRHRRKEPPTPEEIQRNMEIALMKKKNAAALEEKYQTDKPQIKPPASGYESFPKYDDLSQGKKN